MYYILITKKSQFKDSKILKVFVRKQKFLIEQEVDIKFIMKMELCLIII
jgi:hypothetical protein